MLFTILFTLATVLVCLGSFIIDSEAGSSGNEEDIRSRASKLGFEVVGFISTPIGDKYDNLKRKATNGQPGNFLYEFKVSGDDTLYRLGGTSFYNMIEACGMVVTNDKGKIVYRLPYAENVIVTEVDTDANEVETKYHMPEDHVKIAQRINHKLDIARATKLSKASKANKKK